VCERFVRLGVLHFVVGEDAEDVKIKLSREGFVAEGGHEEVECGIFRVWVEF
jgi:hypothetical protein